MAWACRRHFSCSGATRARGAEGGVYWQHQRIQPAVSQLRDVPVERIGAGGHVMPALLLALLAREQPLIGIMAIEPAGRAGSRACP